MSFKIWMQIEELDENGEHKGNATEDIEVGQYDDMKSAQEALDKIIEAA